MATEKVDLTTRGKVVRVLTGQNGPYGIELDNSKLLRRSQFGTVVDLTGIKKDDYLEVIYYESSGKAYAKTIKVIDDPGAGQAMQHDDVFVPEPETSAGAPGNIHSDNGGVSGKPTQEMASGGPEASAPAPSAAPAGNDGGQNGGQKKSWSEKQAEKDQYWENKAGLDMERLTLDREKFEFEKKRADNIAKQAAIKEATDVVLAVYNANPGQGTNVAELITKIYKTAYYLNRPIDVGFTQAVNEFKKAIEPSGPSADQFDGIRQAAAGGPGM